jgi:AcrR family transcriptional regulator
MSDTQGRRAHILNSAAELFARKGITATTVREIADAVGMLSGSLYHHFDSKDAIVAEVLTGHLDTIRHSYAEVLTIDVTPAQQLHQLVLVSLEVAEQLPHPTAIYQNELHYLRENPAFAVVQNAATEIQQIWLGVIEAGVAGGSLRNDIPARVFYRLIRDAVWLSVQWHRPGGQYTTTNLADDVTSIFLDGFRAGR